MGALTRDYANDKILPTAAQPDSLAAMSGRSIVLHTPDALGAKRVTRGLEESGYDVAVANLTATRELIAARAVDLAIVEHTSDAALAAIARDAVARDVPLLALSAAHEPSALLGRMGDFGLDHVIAVSAAEMQALRAATVHEITVAATSLLDGSVPGVARFLGGVAPQERQLSGLVDRERALDDVTDYLAALGVTTGLAASMALVADQLSANALRFGSAPVELAFGCDGSLFAVAVRDAGGALTPAHIAAALDLASTEGKGLLAAMHASSQLVFKLAPGRATEVIAITDLDARASGATGARSVHVFIDRDPAVASAVVLSESMRLDLRSQLSLMSRASRRPAPAVGRDPAPPRRLPRATPDPMTDVHRAAIGVDTLRGLLRGAGGHGMALECALRFLAGHASAALLYRRDGEALTPHMAAGQIARWCSLGRLEPWLRAPSTPAVVARDQSLRAFAPRKRGLDRRIMRTIGVGPGASAWAVPVIVADEVDYVLALFGPTIDRVVAIRMLIDVRAELEDALERLSTPVQLLSRRALDPRRKRAATVPPYAHLELLYPRAITNDEYASLEIDL